MKPASFSSHWWQTRPPRAEAFGLALSFYLAASLLALVGGAAYALSVWIRSLGSGYRLGTRTQLVITHAALCTLILALSFS